MKATWYFIPAPIATLSVITMALEPLGLIIGINGLLRRCPSITLLANLVFASELDAGNVGFGILLGFHCLS